MRAAPTLLRAPVVWCGVWLALALACADEQGGPARDAAPEDATVEVADVVEASPEAATPEAADVDEIRLLDADLSAPDISLGAQPVAGVCSADDDCQDGWCVTAYYGGYCSAPCTQHADCLTGSTYGSVCLASPELGDKMCWKVCQGTWDCRADQFCAGSAGAKV